MRIPVSLTISALLAVLVAAGGAPAAAGQLDGSWTGTYRLGGSGAIDLTLVGTRADVALGVGHADLQAVRATVAGGRVRLALPGRPSLTLDVRLVGDRLVGDVRHGSVDGTIELRREESSELRARGRYVAQGRRLAVIDDPYGPPRLLDLATGAVHGLYPAGRAFAIGAGFATRAPTKGGARFDRTSATIAGVAATRSRLRQLEVRFRSGAATLSGTLTLPAGGGRRAAVAFVAGSGPTERAYLPDLQALLVHHGVAVLAYDKRGVGQSGGAYPGDSPTAATIRTLAADAAAAVRFLRAQPEIDPKRVGLAGHSQAGWIVPLAADRELGVRFTVLFAGPTVTADENDLYQDLTGQGERPQRLTDEEIDAQVLARGPSGFDPLPSIRSLAIPGLWVFGALDRHIPTRLSRRLLEPLAAEAGRDVTILEYAHANHALVETRTGLTAEMLRSATFAPGLFPDVGRWLRSHGLSAAS